MERKLKLEAEAAREEKERFFNLPSADADFSHWSKAAQWFLGEAVALSFGKAPERVERGAVERYVQVSPFALEYSRRSFLVSRAQEAQELSNPVRPKDFIAWARRKEIGFPEELIRLVESLGGVVTDWRAKYLELEADFGKLDDDMNVIIAERDALEERVAELAAVGQGVDPKSPMVASGDTAAKVDRPFQTRERRTMLTIIAALCQYSKLDWVGRGTAQRIREETERLGAPVDDSTISNVLGQVGYALESRMKQG